MKQLQEVGRTNILYALAKGLGTLRSCGTDSLFPSKRMIAGLFEYCANFFSSVNVAQVKLCLLLLLVCILYRYLVQMTTELGCNQCTHFLATNG